jgi:hypothetical protein
MLSINQKLPSAPACVLDANMPKRQRAPLSTQRRYVMKLNRQKSATLNLRLDPTLKDAAARAARDDHRTITSLIEKLLSDHLKAAGYLPEQNRKEGKRR